MNAIKTVAAAALVVMGLFGASALPASAATTPTVAVCQDDLNSSDYGNAPTSFNSTEIASALAERGINAQSVEDWGGCAKVTVVDKSGHAVNQYYDPMTLQRLSIG